MIVSLEGVLKLEFCCNNSQSNFLFSMVSMPVKVFNSYGSLIVFFLLHQLIFLLQVYILLNFIHCGGVIRLAKWEMEYLWMIALSTWHALSG